MKEREEALKIARTAYQEIERVMSSLRKQLGTNPFPAWNGRIYMDEWEFSEQELSE